MLPELSALAMQVRKLEFLLAEAVAQGHDCVITIGGIQSNHCRATAVAARYAHCHSRARPGCCALLSPTASRMESMEHALV